MSTHLFKSSIYHMIVRVCVVISGMCFMGDGCKDPVSTQKPEDIVKKYTGTWLLYYTSRSDAMIYDGKEILTLREDLSFNCTSSFFWRDDSLKTIPLNGTWTAFETAYNESAHTIRYGNIKFTVNSTSLTWQVSSTSSNTTRGLSCKDNVIEYDWILIHQ